MDFSIQQRLFHHWCTGFPSSTSHQHSNMDSEHTTFSFSRIPTPSCTFMTKLEKAQTILRNRACRCYIPWWSRLSSQCSWTIFLRPRWVMLSASWYLSIQTGMITRLRKSVSPHWIRWAGYCSIQGTPSLYRWSHILTLEAKTSSLSHKTL